MPLKAVRFLAVVVASSNTQPLFWESRDPAAPIEV
jgi:hypothetical protein